MYERIVVPLDGSTVALQVVPYAALLAKSTNAEIALVEAVTSLHERLMHPGTDVLTPGTPTKSGDQWQAVMNQVTRDAQGRLDHEAAVLKKSGANVTTAVIEGEPGQAIPAEADKSAGSLIAISTHGRSGIGRWVLGSVTDEVIHRAHCPILVIRARGDEVTSGAPALRRVLLPLDGSELTEAAIPHAVAAAKALGVGITVLRSISPMAYGDTFADYVPAMYDDLAAEIDADVRSYLSERSEAIKSQGVPDVTERAVDGYAATAILEEEGKAGDSLVVMATHARSGVGRWVLGSVADRVIRHGSGPVLLVKPAS